MASGISGSHAFGVMLNRAGYDHLVITGRANRPVVLCIDDDDVHLDDATALWGRKDTYETADGRLSPLQDVPYAFEESARLDPKDGRAYLMMGYCALQSNKKKQAAQALEKAKGFPKREKLAKQLLQNVE